MENLKKITGICLVVSLSMITLSFCSSPGPVETKPRILVSTDIGGTDPDDFQSMIHLLMYADLFQIEGLVSTAFETGGKKDILDMIELYEKDLGKLRDHADGFPDPDQLRKVCKQGATDGAPYKGYNASTQGSDWIIQCANKTSDQPLWVLVWGGLEDVAQALHDDPGIKENIRVYWIGGPNKKWGVNAYAYIAEHHPDLWMIEANATYRGWFIDDESPENISNDGFYQYYIKDRGHMGKAFKNYYKGSLKMGDTPSLAYVMNGNPEDPLGESWGGSFTQINHSSRGIFDRNTTTSDTVIAYGVVEWRFKGPELDIPKDSACFAMEISRQVWPGYYLGNGTYAARYSSKTPETCTYLTSSDIPELNGLAGQFVSIAPWPGSPGQDDYPLGANWYTDKPESALFLGVQQGARTISKHREKYLGDWAQRWEWLK